MYTPNHFIVIVYNVAHISTHITIVGNTYYSATNLLGMYFCYLINNLYYHLSIISCNNRI